MICKCREIIKYKKERNGGLYEKQFEKRIKDGRLHGIIGSTGINRCSVTGKRAV